VYVTFSIHDATIFTSTHRGENLVKAIHLISFYQLWVRESILVICSDALR
jgi:hypothetical protein